MKYWWLVFVLLLIPGVLAQAIPKNLDDKVNEAEQIIGNVEDTVQGLKNNPWEYIGDRWRELLLGIPAVKAVDSFFQKISWFFVIFFGKSYVLSGVLFLSIVFWIHFFRLAGNLMVAYSAFTPWIAWLLGVGMTILIAQVGLFYLLADICFKLLFYREGLWSWVSLPIFVLLNILLFMFLHNIVSIIKRIVNSMRNKEKEETTEKSREVINKTAKAITKPKEPEVDESLPY